MSIDCHFKTMPSKSRIHHWGGLGVGWVRPDARGSAGLVPKGPGSPCLKFSGELKGTTNTGIALKNIVPHHVKSRHVNFT